MKIIFQRFAQFLLKSVALGPDTRILVTLQNLCNGFNKTKMKLVYLRTQERERERECVCVCVCARACVRVCVCVRACV